MEFSCSFVQDLQAKKRHVTFANFYAISSDSDHPSLCYCTDILGLFKEIGIGIQLWIGAYSLTVLCEA